MITVPINKVHHNFVSKYASGLVLGDGVKGGFSNLNKKDLQKASREDYQYTGLYGELAWYLHRYGGMNKFIDILELKKETCKKRNVGDSGFDDSITKNSKTRFLDVKSTHIADEKRIQYLNLVIPQREYHNDMIYVCAFTIGSDRRNVDKVIFAGWCINEDVHKRWPYDEKKFCVPTKELRDIKELEVYIR